ncbi:GNAT family N-acetyltransferase [Streptomyces chrestomyceticus]|uniref:GNAT family N-acetyltransferase n=1 Tax=Streptomyces chrestomyceticus TaxID=68185 RepID=UPI0033D90DB2
MNTVELRHHRNVDAVRQALLDVYADVYADQDPFHSTARFDERLGSHAARPGWEAVVAYDGDEPAGFAYAVPLGPGTAWWDHMITPLPEGYAIEDGRRTLAFNELMIRTAWRGQGLSQRLHDELLAQRDEQRVTLLVDPGHPKVMDLYRTWGYEEIGRQQPFPDSPVFAAMTRPLRIG